jgi:transposase-like protein
LGLPTSRLYFEKKGKTMVRYLITYVTEQLDQQLSLRDAFQSLAQVMDGFHHCEASLVEVDDPAIGEALERICRAAGVHYEFLGMRVPASGLMKPEEVRAAFLETEPTELDPERLAMALGVRESMDSPVPAVSVETGVSVETVEAEDLPVCPYCRESFTPKNSRQTNCKKPECQRAYNREYMANYARRKKADAAETLPAGDGSPEEQPDAEFDMPEFIRQPDGGDPPIAGDQAGITTPEEQPQTDPFEGIDKGRVRAAQIERGGQGESLPAVPGD